MIYVIVLAIVVSVLLTVTVYKTLSIRNKADFMVAGRSLPWYVLVFTLLSSWIGAGSLFGGAENAYRNGFASLWQPAFQIDTVFSGRIVLVLAALKRSLRQCSWRQSFPIVGLVS